MNNKENIEIKVEENSSEVKVESKKEKKDKKDKIIEELQQEVAALKDKNIRVTAEMINSIRRKEEENNRMLKYANESIAADLLSTIDNFERALQTPISSESEGYKKGMEMIYKNLVQILMKYDIKEIESLNKPFDPNFHQAVMTEEKKGVEENVVIEVLQKGYTYKDKVLRPTMVKVSK